MSHEPETPPLIAVLSGDTPKQNIADLQDRIDRLERALYFSALVYIPAAGGWVN